MLFNKILNYSVRLLLIIVGFLLAFGILSSKNSSDDQVYVFRVMGVIVVLFGIYRIIMYHSNLKSLQENEENEVE